jgi:predicted NBD/HSP70 family sugar kinase
LLEQGIATREQLVTATGLSAATVSRVIDDLTKEGLVRDTASLPTGRPGRRITPVEFVGQVGRVVGVDLGGTNCRVIAVDLLGKVLHRVRKAVPEGLSTRKLAGWLANEVRSVVDGAPLYSVTVGLPGIVHPVTSEVRAATNLPQAEGLGFVKALRRQLAVPVGFDNDSNLALLGEMRLGAAQHRRSAVMFTIGTGLGAGVVLDGHLLRGRTGLIGEFGCYLPVGFDGLTLEDVLSASGLVKEAARVGAPVDSARAVLSGRAPKELVAVRNRFEQLLFFALVGMTTAYEPEVIVLGGGVAESLGEILPEIEQRLKALIPECPALAISKLGDPAGAVGALIVGLQDAYMQMGVNPSELDVTVGPRLVELLQSSERETEHVA